MDLYVCTDVGNVLLEVFNNLDAAMNSWLISYSNSEIEFKYVGTRHDHDVYIGDDCVGHIVFKPLYTHTTHL